MIEKKRLTSAKVKIRDITEGKYVPGEGLSPNYVLSPAGRRLSRVWITGTVVAKYVMSEKNFYTVTLDDSSATIRAKAFGSRILEKLSEGDIAEIIGKIRQYGDEVYVMPEVVWKAGVNSEMMRELDIRQAAEDWKQKVSIVLDCRKQAADSEELKNLSSETGISEEDVDAILEAQETIEAGLQEQKSRILSVIEDLDAGEGCDYAALMKKAGLEEQKLDEIVQELLEEGSCFEPRPGKIKKV